MSAGPFGFSNPVARALFNASWRVENFARWWNRQITIPRGAAVRPPRPEGVDRVSPHPFPKINHRDVEQGFAPDSISDGIGLAIGTAVGRAIEERDRRERRRG